MPGLPDTQPAPDLPDERRLALVVATETYEDASLRRLRAPGHDAEDLGAVLADPGVGGFSVTSVIDGTAQEVRIAVGDFLADRRPDDLVLVYLSCHGLVDLRRRLYFAARDTTKERLSATGVEAKWLLDQLEDCRAKRQVLILDCCFSGAFALGAKGDEDLGIGQRFSGQGRGRAVLTASRDSEYSFEGEPTPGQEVPGSIFTSALVDGIRSGAADLDQDGYVSVDDAYGYAFDAVRASRAEQTPQRWFYGAEGSILLARNPAGVTIIPARVPDGILSSLDSSYPSVRIGAVEAIAEWLHDDDPARVLAARQTLVGVAEHDRPEVAVRAQGLLDAVKGGRPAAAGSGDDRGPSSSESGPAAAPDPDQPPRVRGWLSGRRLVYPAGVLLAIAAAVVTWNLRPDQPPAPPVSPVSREAEQGDLIIPMQTYDDPEASGGEYVATPTKDKGSVAIDFRAPREGTYYFWGRVMSPRKGFNSNSVRVAVDEVPEQDDNTVIWDFFEKDKRPPKGWAWDRISLRGAGGTYKTHSRNPWTRSLTEGKHTLVLAGREIQSRVDKILVTDDPAYTPST